MGFFVKNREVEGYYHDLWGEVFCLNGEKPKPYVLVDDIERCYYKAYAFNSTGEKIYFRVNFHERFGEDDEGSRAPEDRL